MVVEVGSGQIFPTQHNVHKSRNVPYFKLPRSDAKRAVLGDHISTLFACGNNAFHRRTPTDTITATARFDSSLVASVTTTNDLGSSSLRWRDLYARDIDARNGTFTGNITVTGTVDGIDVSTRDAVLTSTTTTANAALPKAGGTMTGAIAMGTKKITGMGDPTSAQDAATKAYVDGSSASSSFIITDDTSSASVINNGETLDFRGSGIATTSISSNDTLTITVPTQTLATVTAANGTTSNAISVGRLTVDSITINQNNITTNDTNANLVLLANGTGLIEVDSNIDMNSNKIVNVTNPSNAQDAATKAYVDAQLTAQDLTISTAGNTGTGSVSTSQTLQALGTTNEINVNAAGTALSFSLADDISGINSLTANTSITTPRITRTGDLVVDVSGDIFLDAGGKDIIFQYDGVQFGLFTASGTDLLIQSGSTTMLTGSGANANFANNVTVPGTMDAGNVTTTGNISNSVLTITSNNITGIRTNEDIILDPNGTGDVVVQGAIRLPMQSGDPTTDSSSGYIYSKLDTNAEVHVKDGAGNVTKISPHNDAGEWEYYSVNKRTGKTIRVNMERMIRKLEQLTGETFIETD